MYQSTIWSAVRKMIKKWIHDFVMKRQEVKDLQKQIEQLNKDQIALREELENWTDELREVESEKRILEQLAALLIREPRIAIFADNMRCIDVYAKELKKYENVRIRRKISGFPEIVYRFGCKGEVHED